MSAVAQLLPTARTGISASRLVILLVLAADLLLISFSIAHHEHWTDEAQAWLLARDVSLPKLLATQLRYEGTPGLWHIVLHVCMQFGLPYGWISAVSAIAALTSAGLLLMYAPFPLWARALLPFTYLLAYQYAVVARSYALVPPLLFAISSIYSNWERRIGMITALLILLAAVSAHAYLLSASIALGLGFRIAGRWSSLNSGLQRTLIFNAGWYVLMLAAIATLAWPTQDTTFARLPDLGPDHIFHASIAAFQWAFGPGLLPLLILLPSIPLLYRGSGLLTFVLAIVSSCLFGAAEYSSIWHHGLLFLIWLFAIWISAQDQRLSTAALSGLLLAIAVQYYWLISSVMYDWGRPYSGSLAAADYFREKALTTKRIAALGFASVGVQPYFRQSVFFNFNDGQRSRSFWDWSKRNHSNDVAEHLGTAKPDYVLVSYMSEPEKVLWSYLVTASGYRLLQHFEGNIIWGDRIIQPDAMDLYVPAGPTRSQMLNSSLRMADPQAKPQLLWGFYELSNGAWRWSARTFTVALNRPPGAERRGATLHLQFYVPDKAIRTLGSIKLAAAITGRRLRSMKLEQGGSFEYVADVPADAMFQQILSIDFRFNKTMPPSPPDKRELGAVITAVSLCSK